MTATVTGTTTRGVVVELTPVSSIAGREGSVSLEAGLKSRVRWYWYRGEEDERSESTICYTPIAMY